MLNFPVCSRLRIECAHGLGSRSAAGRLCQKFVRIFTLTTSVHLFVAVVSMSVQSVGGDEIHVFSLGMARAAAIPVGALEAGDLMGETPRGKKARYAGPAGQKAEEIGKKTLGSNLEKTMLEDLRRVVSKFCKLTNRLIRTSQREYSKFNKFKGRTYRLE